MKSGWLATAFIVLLAVAFVIGALAWWTHTRLIYPTPETESVFLKNYTPAHVVDRFRENESFQSMHHNGAGAGDTFVTHNSGFEFYIVLRRDKWEPLMEALRDDVLQQLANDGAKVLSQTGTACDRFQLDYSIGKSVGSVTISPVEITPPSQAQRNYALPRCTNDVTVKIEQTEKWFPNALVKCGLSACDI